MAMMRRLSSMGRSRCFHPSRRNLNDVVNGFLRVGQRGVLSRSALLGRARGTSVCSWLCSFQVGGGGSW